MEKTAIQGGRLAHLADKIDFIGNVHPDLVKKVHLPQTTHTPQAQNPFDKSINLVSKKTIDFYPIFSDNAGTEFFQGF